MESVSPNIFVNDIKETIAFYKILGFNVNAAVPDEENPIFVLMTCGSTTFMFQTFASLGNDLPQIKRQDGGSLLLYIQIKGIRSFFETIKDKVTVLKELEKTFYGATEFSIIDNNSYILTFAEDEK
ncbi:MAG: glyoxalase [Bacteroidales bacterium]|nr:glyoxalase [Bacteroidales bacterium]